MIRLTCVKNGATIGPSLTDGKAYEARHIKNALWAIRDDRGFTRYVIPGAKCPHLKEQVTVKGFPVEKCVGYWKPTTLMDEVRLRMVAIVHGEASGYGDRASLRTVLECVVRPRASSLNALAEEVRSKPHLLQDSDVASLVEEHRMLTALDKEATAFLAELSKA